MIVEEKKGLFPHVLGFCRRLRNRRKTEILCNSILVMHNFFYVAVSERNADGNAPEDVVNDNTDLTLPQIQKQQVLLRVISAMVT